MIKHLSLFLVLVTLVAAPLRVSAMDTIEGIGDKDGENGKSGTDRTGENSKTAADQAVKASYSEAAAGAGSGFTDDDDNSEQNAKGAPASSISQITADKYCTFLNAVAASDPHHLYDEKIATDLEGGCILRSGVVGSYSYSVIQGKKVASIQFLSWLDTMRYCNWLENGSVTSFASAEAIDVTEHGSYELQNDQLVSINPDAIYLVENNSGYDPELGSNSFEFHIINTKASSSLARESSGGSGRDTSWEEKIAGIAAGVGMILGGGGEEHVAEGTAGDRVIGPVEAKYRVTDGRNKAPQLNSSLGQHRSPLMMFGGDEEQTSTLKTSDSRTTDSRGIGARGGASADSSSDAVRGTASGLAEDGEDESSLTLDHFKTALAAHPDATRFVINEDEENGISIQPLAAGTSKFASSKNKVENTTIIDALRELLVTRHGGSSEIVTSFFDGVSSSADTPLSAESLRNILSKSDAARKPISSKKAIPQKIVPPAAEPKEVLHITLPENSKAPVNMQDLVNDRIVSNHEQRCVKTGEPKPKHSSWKTTAFKSAAWITASLFFQSELLSASSNFSAWRDTRIQPLCDRLEAHHDSFPNWARDAAPWLGCQNITDSATWTTLQNIAHAVEDLEKNAIRCHSNAIIDTTGDAAQEVFSSHRDEWGNITTVYERGRYLAPEYKKGWWVKKIEDASKETACWANQINIIVSSPFQRIDNTVSNHSKEEYHLIQPVSKQDWGSEQVRIDNSISADLAGPKPIIFGKDQTAEGDPGDESCDWENEATNHFAYLSAASAPILGGAVLLVRSWITKAIEAQRRLEATAQIPSDQRIPEATAKTPPQQTVQLNAADDLQRLKDRETFDYLNALNKANLALREDIFTSTGDSRKKVRYTAQAVEKLLKSETEKTELRKKVTVDHVQTKCSVVLIKLKETFGLSRDILKEAVTALNQAADFWEKAAELNISSATKEAYRQAAEKSEHASELIIQAAQTSYLLGINDPNGKKKHLLREAGKSTQLNAECGIKEKEATNEQIKANWHDAQVAFQAASDKFISASERSIEEQQSALFSEGIDLKSQGMGKKYWALYDEAKNAKQKVLIDGYWKAAKTSELALEWSKYSIKRRSEKANQREIDCWDWMSKSIQSKADYEAKAAEAQNVQNSTLATGYSQAVETLIRNERNWFWDGGNWRFWDGFRSAGNCYLNLACDAGHSMYCAGMAIQSKADYEAKAAEAQNVKKTNLAAGYTQAANRNQAAVEMYKKSEIAFLTPRPKQGSAGFKWGLPKQGNAWLECGKTIQAEADYLAKAAEAEEEGESGKKGLSSKYNIIAGNFQSASMSYEQSAKKYADWFINYIQEDSWEGKQSFDSGKRTHLYAEKLADPIKNLADDIANREYRINRLQEIQYQPSLQPRTVRVVPQSNQAAREDPTLWNSLSQVEQAELTRNQSVVRTVNPNPIDNDVLPTVTVYRIINASPLNVAATFWNTDNAQHIIPNFSSIRVEQNRLNSVVTTLRIALPLKLGTPSVRTTSRVTTPFLNHYRISFEATGDMIRRSGGSLLAEPRGENQTLICYESSAIINFDAISWLIRGIAQSMAPGGAEQNARDTINNLVARITTLRETNTFNDHITILNRSINENPNP